MTAYRVFVRQAYERTGNFQIDAESPKEAIAKATAALQTADVEWDGGGSSDDVEMCEVQNDNCEVVWTEREDAV